MRYILIALFLFLSLPLPSSAQAPTATPSPGGINVPYDFTPFVIPTVPSGWGIQQIDSGELVENTGRSAITTLEIANNNNILVFIVLIGLAWMVVVFLYEYNRKPASNSELNLSHAYKIIKNTTPQNTAKFKK